MDDDGGNTVDCDAESMGGNCSKHGFIPLCTACCRPRTAGCVPKERGKRRNSWRPRLCLTHDILDRTFNDGGYLGECTSFSGQNLQRETGGEGRVDVKRR